MFLATSCSIQANGSKEAFRKHMESVLQKQAKLRSLTKELDQNYPTDEVAKKQLCRNQITHKIMHIEASTSLQDVCSAAV